MVDHFMISPRDNQAILMLNYEIKALYYTQLQRDSISSLLVFHPCCGLVFVMFFVYFHCTTVTKVSLFLSNALWVSGRSLTKRHR